ncbi:hypothetical protein SAMN04488700_1645 [Carnobacterium iners]|uniref:Uncharacterized protein n=1 Tax=Carnobacterium iners TaxID=1073423 RepID=A0A1X7N9F7_9LACT|nr:hypothetical protein SAMN04488114_1058 [Carnobacterium iners]SMH34182.1 hypothetical protein SAMN04488700_1645 [Carnobacterium iners]
MTLKSKKLHEIDKIFDKFFSSLPDLDRLEIRERERIFHGHIERREEKANTTSSARERAILIETLDLL